MTEDPHGETPGAKAHDQHNNYWLWGPPSADPAETVVVGFLGQEVEENGSPNCTTHVEVPHAARRRQRGRRTTSVGVRRPQRVSMGRFWPKLKSYRA